MDAGEFGKDAAGGLKEAAFFDRIENNLSRRTWFDFAKRLKTIAKRSRGSGTMSPSGFQGGSPDAASPGGKI